MKHSLFLPLAIISLTLSSCTLIRGVESTCKVDTDCKDTEMCYFKPEGITGSCVLKTETKPAEEIAVTIPSTDPITPGEIPTNPAVVPETKPTTTPDLNTAPQPTKENPEVSTEDLTKELDAFVDDITKGL